jgi:hypothetical protein
MRTKATECVLFVLIFQGNVDLFNFSLLKVGKLDLYWHTDCIQINIRDMEYRFIFAPISILQVDVFPGKFLIGRVAAGHVTRGS